MIQMTIPKCWIQTIPESSEYMRYIAPHIAPDCWFEVHGLNMIINFHGTQTALDWVEYTTLKQKAFDELQDHQYIKINELTSQIIDIMVAEYVIAGLIEKANQAYEGE